MSQIIIVFCSAPHLTQIHHLEQAIERVTAEIVRRFTPPPPPEEGTSTQKKQEAAPERVPDSESPAAPPAAVSWAEAGVLLCRIPGIGERAAMGILAEIGINMRASPACGTSGLLGWCLPRQS